MFIACGLYWLCDAIELGLMGYLIPILKEEWSLAPAASDSIASIVFGGIVLGALVFGFLSDRIGRRWVFFISAAGTGVFGIASAFAPNIYVMLVLRCLCGVFLGGGPSAYSLYLEFTPSNYYWVLPYFNLWFTVGSVFEAGLALALLSTFGNSVGWRYLVIVSGGPIFLVSFLIPWLRESLHWLHGVNRDPEVLVGLDRLYGPHRKRTAAVAPAKLLKKQSVLNSISILCSRKYIRRFFCFIVIWFATNLVYYGVSFFSTAYFIQVLPAGETQALLILLVVCSGEVVGAFIAAFLVPRVSRRATCFVFLSLASVFFYLLLAWDNLYFRASCVLCARAMVFATFTNIYLWSPLCIPTHVRSTAMGIFSSIGKIASITAPFIASGFEGQNVIMPATVFGSAAIACAVVCLLVGVEPQPQGSVSAGEESPLLRGNTDGDDDGDHIGRGGE